MGVHMLKKYMHHTCKLVGLDSFLESLCVYIYIHTPTCIHTYIHSSLIYGLKK